MRPNCSLGHFPENEFTRLYFTPAVLVLVLERSFDYVGFFALVRFRDFLKIRQGVWLK